MTKKEKYAVITMSHTVAEGTQLHNATMERNESGGDSNDIINANDEMLSSAFESVSKKCEQRSNYSKRRSFETKACLSPTGLPSPCKQAQVLSNFHYHIQPSQSST